MNVLILGMILYYLEKRLVINPIFSIAETIKVPGMGDSISEGTIEEFVKRKYLSCCQRHSESVVDICISF